MGTLITEQASLLVGRRELGLTRDKYTRAMLRTRLASDLASGGVWTRSAPIITPANLQDWVDAFSESYALSAVVNITEYFRRLAVSGLTPGGRRGASRPLVYDPRRLQPNPTELGAFGEGVSGYYLERVLGLNFEVRPFGVNPDFVFIEPGTRTTHLVQVKTTLASRRTSDLTEAIKLLDVLAKTKFMRAGKYIADVLTVSVLAVDNFNLRHLEIEEV